MDTLDLKVIKQLMEQGRTSWADLGALLGLTAPAAADRVRRLEERQVIQKYVAVVDPEKVGCGLTAFITIILEKPEHRTGFVGIVQTHPEIQECHHIAGEEDYLLKVRCGGIPDLEKLVSERIKGLPGVVKTRTTIVMSTLKETTALPLPEKA